MESPATGNADSASRSLLIYRARSPSESLPSSSKSSESSTSAPRVGCIASLARLLFENVFAVPLNFMYANAPLAVECAPKSSPDSFGNATTQDDSLTVARPNAFVEQRMMVRAECQGVRQLVVTAALYRANVGGFKYSQFFIIGFGRTSATLSLALLPN